MLDSCNTFVICEQETSKAPESQSPSSLSWQSTVVVIDMGAVGVLPQHEGSLNSEPSSSRADAEELCPQSAVTPLHKGLNGNSTDTAVPAD